jgi:hypothetical protein
MAKNKPLEAYKIVMPIEMFIESVRGENPDTVLKFLESERLILKYRIIGDKIYMIPGDAPELTHKFLNEVYGYEE